MPEPAHENVDNALLEADRITQADRQRYYGHPLDNHGTTAEMWHAYLLRRGWTAPKGGEEALNVRDVCMMNVLLKISRDANAPKRDNLVDGAGYLRNAEQAEQETARRAELAASLKRIEQVETPW